MGDALRDCYGDGANTPEKNVDQASYCCSIAPSTTTSSNPGKVQPCFVKAGQTFWKRFQRRLFRGKGVMLVLLINTLANLAYFSTSISVYGFIFNEALPNTSANSALQQVLRNGLFKIMYPFCGFAADVYFGRHSVIRWSLFMMWGALAMLSISVALYEGGYRSPVTEFVIPIPALVLLSVGLAGLKSNIIPFGVDQLEGASSDQISSYFYWYYWVINVGGVIGLAIIYIMDTTGVGTTATNYTMPLVATALLTVALCLHIVFDNLFDKTRESYNPLRLVIKIIYFAATVKRTSPRRRRAFRYGEIPPSRIDLAKVDYDGKFTHEQVEDVKTFCLIILVYVSLAGAFLSYGGLYTMISHELAANSSDVRVNDVMPALTVYLLQNLSTMVNAGTIIVFIPFFNNFLFPLLGNYTPNLRKRIAIGILFEIGAGLLCVVIEATDHSSIPELIVLPMIPLSIAEILIYITGMEFIYAQSPHTMRGFLIGLLFGADGFFSAVAAVLFLTTPDSKMSCPGIANKLSSNCVFLYYVMYTAVVIIGFAMYVTVALIYKNRERDNVENHKALVTEYYDKAYQAYTSHLRRTACSLSSTVPAPEFT